MYVSDRWCECYLQLSTVRVSVPGEEELVEAGHRCGEAPSTSSQATISGRQAITRYRLEATCTLCRHVREFGNIGR